MTCPRKISLLWTLFTEQYDNYLYDFLPKKCHSSSRLSNCESWRTVAHYVLLKATPEWASFLELQSFEYHVREPEPISVKVLFCLLIWIFSIYKLSGLRNLSDSELHLGFSKLLAYSMSLDWNLVRTSTTKYNSNIFFHKMCKKLWENNTTCTKNPRAK